MKYIVFCCFLMSLYFQISCSKKVYLNNGESIYKTGKNLNGEIVLDKKASRIRIFTSCQSCHGKKGNAMRKVSIQFKRLSDSNYLPTPYTDSLFYRFLDSDLKSDGSIANIGVIWKMSDKDKKDLLDYLKSL